MRTTTTTVGAVKAWGEYCVWWDPMTFFSRSVPLNFGYKCLYCGGRCESQGWRPYVRSLDGVGTRLHFLEKFVRCKKPAGALGGGHAAGTCPRPEVKGAQLVVMM